MAVISRSSNEKPVETRWGGNWRPSTAQIGGGLATLGSVGALGYLANMYPKQTTALVQKGLHGAIGMIPGVAVLGSAGNLPRLGTYAIEKGLSSVLPFGASVNTSNLGSLFSKGLSQAANPIKEVSTPFYSASSSGFPITPFYSATSGGFPDLS